MLVKVVIILWAIAAGLQLANANPLERRLTRSKLNQFSGPYCDGNGKDAKANRISTNVDIADETCIDIDGATHSIFLARGTGLVYRRKMVAYAQTGCPFNMRIAEFKSHDANGPCMNVDLQMLGIPGSDINQGRIMSVKFHSF